MVQEHISHTSDLVPRSGTQHREPPTPRSGTQHREPPTPRSGTQHREPPHHDLGHSTGNPTTTIWDTAQGTPPPRSGTQHREPPHPTIWDTAQGTPPGPCPHSVFDVALLQGGPQLCVVVLAEGVQVVAYGAHEEHGVLGDDGQLGAQVFQTDGADVQVIDDDAAPTQLHQAE